MHLFMNINITYLCMHLFVKPKKFYKSFKVLFITQLNSIEIIQKCCIENVASGFVRDANVH